MLLAPRALALHPSYRVELELVSGGAKAWKHVYTRFHASHNTEAMPLAAFHRAIEYPAPSPAATNVLHGLCPDLAPAMHAFAAIDTCRCAPEGVEVGNSLLAMSSLHVFLSAKARAIHPN